MKRPNLRMTDKDEGEESHLSFPPSCPPSQPHSLGDAYVALNSSVAHPAMHCWQTPWHTPAKADWGMTAAVLMPAVALPALLRSVYVVCQEEGQRV